MTKLAIGDSSPSGHSRVEKSYMRTSITREESAGFLHEESGLDRALQKMRDALAILDEHECFLAAVHLCRALETLEPTN